MGSHGHLGEIERGEKPLDNRQMLARLSVALQVAPSELTGQPWDPTDPVGADAHAALMRMETALDAFDLDTAPAADRDVRPWPEVAANVEMLRQQIYLSSDYAALGETMPPLLADLRHYSHHRAHRREALIGLIHAHASAVWAGKRLGARGLPQWAAGLAYRCATELADPAWTGYAGWLRAEASAELSREHHYTRASAAADELGRHVGAPDSDSAQMFGMLQLTAAMGAAARGDADTSTDHLAEARTLANRMSIDVGRFAELWFGRINLGVWETALRVELGADAREIAAAPPVPVDVIPSPSRQAEHYAELGRVLLGARSRDARALQTRGLELVLEAERRAPQRVRADVFVREAVSDALARVRRDAGSRELRALAWRMGTGPMG